MKRSLRLGVVMGMVAFSGCGPDAQVDVGGELPDGLAESGGELAAVAFSVRVTAAGAPVANVYVLAVSDEGKAVERRLTDASGVARFAKLAPRVKAVPVDRPVMTARREGRSVVELRMAPGFDGATEVTAWRPREVNFDVGLVPEVGWATGAVGGGEREAALVVLPPRSAGLLDLMPAGTQPESPDDSVRERWAGGSRLLEARFTAPLRLRNLGSAYDAALLTGLTATLSHGDGRGLPVRLLAASQPLIDGVLGATGPGGSYLNTVAAADAVFSDTRGHRHAGRFAFAKASGFARADDRGALGPDLLLTRAELARLAIEASGLRVVDAPAVASFPDVPKAHPAFRFVESAKALGLMRAYGDGDFKPNARVARLELAAVLVGAAGWALVPHDGRFRDAPSLTWAATGLTTAHAYCRALEPVDGRIAPNSSVTRAEAIVAFARAAECRVRLDL